MSRKSRKKIIHDITTTNTGMAVMLKVYIQTIPVGVGYVVYYDGPDTGEPTLCNFQGKPFPEGWLQLEAYDKVLVVVPRNIQ